MTDDDEIILIQTSVSGFGGAKACTLYSTLHTETGRLLIAKMDEYTNQRKKEDFYFICTDVRADYDTLVTLDGLVNSVDTYVTMANAKMDDGEPALNFKDDMQLIDPLSHVEGENLKRSGMDYVVDVSELPNACVALLATCQFAADNFDAQGMVEMSGDFSDLSAMQITTIM